MKLSSYSEKNERRDAVLKPSQNRGISEQSVQGLRLPQPPSLTSTPYNFAPQFDRSEIDELVKRRRASVNEQDTMEAGRSIRAGKYFKENVRVIVSWKVEGLWPDKHLAELDQNSDDQIAQALEKALTAENEQAAVEELDKLIGIGVPVASAILTAVYPERYTIIDINALTGLGVSNELQERSMPIRSPAVGTTVFPSPFQPWQ